MTTAFEHARERQGLDDADPRAASRGEPSEPGEILTEISAGMMRLLVEFYGHGPVEAKSYYADDLVVCVIRNESSRIEQTLFDAGRGRAVIQQRMAFQDTMRERFSQVIEAATGRTVIAFMSGNQQAPEDIMCEVFILAPHRELIDR